jgi:hypothetical protein
LICFEVRPTCEDCDKRARQTFRTGRADRQAAGFAVWLGFPVPFPLRTGSRPPDDLKQGKFTELGCDSVPRTGGIRRCDEQQKANIAFPSRTGDPSNARAEPVHHAGFDTALDSTKTEARLLAFSTFKISSSRFPFG